MPANRIRLKIDLAGTTGDEAWRSLKHYEEMNEARYGPAFGSSGPCGHHGGAHTQGEWMGAIVDLPSPIIAQYAIRHYLGQPRVLDAEMDEER
ncbi:MAG TPA: hypothetical protein VE998_06415 [Terriglobales bacterium]|nr:hypothetical protein [Terriglobales bacterium]